MTDYLLYYYLNVFGHISNNVIYFKITSYVYKVKYASC